MTMLTSREKLTRAPINIDVPHQLLCGSRLGLFGPLRIPVGRNRLRRNLLGHTPLHQLYNKLRCGFLRK